MLRALFAVVAAVAGLLLPKTLPAFQVENRADWNFTWPAQSKTFYNLDFDFKIEGLQKSLYVHTYLGLQSANIYFGAQTDDNGDPTTLLFTVWFKNRSEFDSKKYAMAGAECRPDDRPAESANGYVSCFLRNFSGKKGTWYRMRVWSTSDVVALDGKTKVKEWGAWILEIDDRGNTIKETMIGKIAASTGWITTAAYSALEGFGDYGAGLERCVTIANQWHGKVSLKFPTYNKGEVVSGRPTNAMVTDSTCNIRGKVVGGTIVTDYGPATKTTSLNLVGVGHWLPYTAAGDAILSPGKAATIRFDQASGKWLINNGDGARDLGTLTGSQMSAFGVTGEVLPAARMIRWSNKTYWVHQ